MTVKSAPFPSFRDKDGRGRFPLRKCVKKKREFGVILYHLDIDKLGFLR